MTQNNVSCRPMHVKRFSGHRVSGVVINIVKRKKVEVDLLGPARGYLGVLWRVWSTAALCLVLWLASSKCYTTSYTITTTYYGKQFNVSPLFALLSAHTDAITSREYVMVMF